MTITASFDKGLVLTKTGTGITTAYQYTPVVNLPGVGTLTPTNGCVQYSGAARKVSLWVAIDLDAAANITKVFVSIESAYGDYNTGAAAVAVDLAVAPWAQILSTVHQGAGTTNVNSQITAPAAGASALVLITCDLPVMAKNLRVGIRGDAAGVAGDAVRVFMGAL